VSSNSPHMVVWVDHQVAKLYGLTRHSVDKIEIHAPDAGRGHIHHHAGTPGPGHHAADKTFLENISAAMGEAQEVLIVGPAEAKHALKSFLEERHPGVAARVMGVEAMDHAGDAEIISAARLFFAKADRMAPARE